MMNYVGSDKEIAQTDRKVNLEPENSLIKLYNEQIYQAAQLPPKEFLEGAGKVESGIALKITYQQMIELLSDLTTIFDDYEEELVSKLYYYEYGKELKSIEIEYENTGIPSENNESLEFMFDKQKMEAGVMTEEEFKNR